MPDGKASKALKTVKRRARIHFVISRSGVRVTPPAPERSENLAIFASFYNFLKNFLTHINFRFDPHQRLFFSVIFNGCFPRKPGLTHTLTHTAKGSERRKECRTEFCVPCGIFSPLLLSNLRHEVPHLFGGFLLHLPCGVRVGAEGEARIVVSQHG